MFKETEDIVCTACNVLDIGTVISESDTQAHVVLSGTDTAELQAKITQIVRSIESDSAEMTIKENGEGHLDMIIDFCCAAEKLIFEMHIRRLM